MKCTDEMVEAACKAYARCDGWTWTSAEEYPLAFAAMRAALETLPEPVVIDEAALDADKCARMRHWMGSQLRAWVRDYGQAETLHVIHYVFGASVSALQGDQLRAELEKTRAELEAKHAKLVDPHWLVMYDALREQHEALRAACERWFAAQDAASCDAAYAALRALLKPAPAEAEHAKERLVRLGVAVNEATRKSLTDARIDLGPAAEPVQHPPPESAMVEQLPPDRRIERAVAAPPESTLAALIARQELLEKTFVTFLSGWSRGAFTKDRAAGLLDDFRARKAAL